MARCPHTQSATYRVTKSKHERIVGHNGGRSRSTMSAKHPACMPHHSRSADLLPKHTQITERSQHQHSKEPASKLDTVRKQRSQH